MTPREVSEKGLFFRFGGQLRGGLSFWYPDKEQPDPDAVVIRDGDCGEVRPTRTIPRAEFDQRVRDYGLWRKVGLWDFTRADDPAANVIAYCHRSPQSAGHMLWRYQERLRRLEWITRLYDAALNRLHEAQVNLWDPGPATFDEWWEGLSFDDLPQEATQERAAELAFEAGRTFVIAEDGSREAYEKAVLRVARIREWLPAPDVIE
jgi:hypothetical protein